jgi:hypothetical protein
MPFAVVVRTAAVINAWLAAVPARPLESVTFKVTVYVPAAA